FAQNLPFNLAKKIAGGGLLALAFSGSAKALRRGKRPNKSRRPHQPLALATLRQILGPLAARRALQQRPIHKNRHKTIAPHKSDARRAFDRAASELSRKFAVRLESRGRPGAMRRA